MTIEQNLPRKTREQQCAVWDSTRLNDFPFRPDDIMICTWSKTGTTWMQQIVAQLVLQGSPEASHSMSPWPEFRLLPKEQWFAIAEGIPFRRFIKTHSPLDAIPYREDLKYIYVGRDVRDVVWSMYHHQSSFTPGAYAAFNNAPGLVGPPLAPTGCDIKAYYHRLLDHEEFPGLSKGDFWNHFQGYFNARRLPNVLLVHYANLKADFNGEARRIAKFLGIDIDEALWPQIAEHCTIDWMRSHANAEMLTQIFDGGAEAFFNKGTNGRWKDVLTPAEIAKADQVAAQHLTPECAHWLKTGELPA